MIIYAIKPKVGKKFGCVRKEANCQKRPVKHSS